MTQDPIALLLPDADEEESLRARKLTTFLRLLSSDSRAQSAGSAQIVLARAREDLEHDRSERLASALENLLQRHLEFELGRDEFSWFGAPKLSSAEAWGVTLEMRAELSWLPEVPRPGENALQVAERLFEALARLLGNTLRIRLWRARLRQVRDGLEAGRASLEVLTKLRGHVPLELQAASVAGVAECLLTKGAVREASHWLAEHASLRGKSTRLAQLESWTRVLLGESTPGILRAGPLPAALCELREGAPSLVASLPGPSASRAREERWRPHGDTESPVVRGAIGASVVAGFAFRAGVATAVSVEVAPALESAVEGWLEERENASTDSSDPQHELIVGVRSVLLNDHELRGLALGGERTKRVALEPILDNEGEVCGWLHFEFEHLATPSRRGLRELAATWRDRILSWQPRVSECDSGIVATVKSARRAAFAALMDSAGLRLKRRRWWGLDVTLGAPQLIAQGGLGLSETELELGRGRALRRALAAAGIVQFDESRPGLGVHPEANSGVVLPIRGSAGVVACLVIESARRKDFSAADLERIAALTEAAGIRFRVARFADWHAEQFGVGVAFPVERSTFAPFAERVARLASANSSLTISGPAGSGKRVLARWIMLESGAEPCVELSCLGLENAGELARAFESAAGGFLVVTDLERTHARQQLEFLSLLQGQRGKPDRCRVLVLTREPLSKLAERDELRDDLALELSRVGMNIPALSDRRTDIPALAQFLAERIAREEEVAVPRLNEELLASLWRQSWPSNVRGLEAAVTAIVLAQDEKALDLAAPALESAAGKVLARIPSRKPRASDLVAALCTTRTASGRINKTRAALYLGWDPDTLVARLRDLKLAEEDWAGFEPWTA